MVCDPPCLILKHTPDAIFHILSSCPGLIEMGPVRQVTEPPWASVSHIERVHATNWEYSLDFTEVNIITLHHIGVIVHFGAGLLQNLYSCV